MVIIPFERTNLRYFKPHYMTLETISSPRQCYRIGKWVLPMWLRRFQRLLNSIWIRDALSSCYNLYRSVGNMHVYQQDKVCPPHTLEVHKCIKLQADWMTASCEITNLDFGTLIHCKT